MCWTRSARDNPVALTSIDGHTVWANTPGLRGLGITGHTPDPDGGEIVRDASGRHTGILRESAVFPVRALAASGLSGNLRGAARETQRYLLSLGMTTVHDIDGADALAAYETLRAEGALGLRVHKLLAAGRPRRGHRGRLGAAARATHGSATAR